MPQRAGSYFHLHLVSDATGETLTTVARAATAQYTKVLPVEHVYPLVRTQKQLDRVLAEIEESPGIVLYTLLDDALSRGVGVVLISTDFEEVAHESHRALVFKDGLIVREIAREDLTVESLVAHASGAAA